MFNDDNFQNNEYEINKYKTKYEHNSGDGTKENPKVIDYWTEKQWREIDETNEMTLKIEESKNLKKSILKTIIITILIIFGICFTIKIIDDMNYGIKVCSVCHGTKVYNGDTCYKCFGEGIEYRFKEE